jgi:A/G-specific adenine glycosylase
MPPKTDDSPPLAPAWRRSLARRLMAWFDRTARDLPWRQTRDLYAIWISEVMLQQTQVATVVPYWNRFLARFPTVSHLAAADEQEVLILWEGLGYYRRARQLHAAARAIAGEHGGDFPSDFAAVRALPGIGRYTAGAILSIGLDQRLPILEANSIRVLSRLTAYEGDVGSSAGQKRLWEIAAAVLPASRCGTFNQALMELGSEICTPKAPACAACPAAKLCAARQRAIVERIPRPSAKTKYEDVTEVAVVVKHRGRVLLRQCQPGERWAGLWDFPRFAKGGAANEEQFNQHVQEQTARLTGIAALCRGRVATLKHGVTRFRITLHCYEAAPVLPLKRRSLLATARWVAASDLGDYPLSTTGRKISGLLQ